MRFLRSFFSKIGAPRRYQNRYADTPVERVDYPKCSCFDEYYAWQDPFDGMGSDEDYEKLEDVPLVWSESHLHVEDHSRSQRAWDTACEILDTTAKKGLKTLNLGKIMDRSDFKA